METNKMVRLVAIGAVALVAIIIFFNSWVDVEPGEQGFVFRPYNSPSIVEEEVYDEGTYFILPWNKMITYEVVNKSKQYNQKVMDINGTDVTLEVSVNYNIESQNVAKLHKKHRENDRDKGGHRLDTGADAVGEEGYQPVRRRNASQG